MTIKPFNCIQPVRKRFWKAMYTHYTSDNLPELVQRYLSASPLLRFYEHTAFVIETLRSMFARVVEELTAVAGDMSTITERELRQYAEGMVDDGWIARMGKTFSEASVPRIPQNILCPFALARSLGTMITISYGEESHFDADVCEC